MKAAGYTFSGSWASAENIAWASLRAPSGYQDEVQLLHTNLMNSPGHRTNLLNGTYREIGIGFEVGEYQGWQGAFVTQNFARSGTGSFLTGVTYADRDGDRFYDPGEGLAGISVRAVSATGQSYAATTMSAGGYDLALPAGTYTVTLSGVGIATTTKQVVIGTSNVKLDVKAAALAAGAVASTAASSGDDVLSGSSGADALQGFEGRDKLSGGAGHDTLDGGSGNDTLSGSTGDDRLYGRDGADFLSGGAGSDRLIGGTGADTFQFRSTWGSDKVVDFQDGIDRLDLRSTGLTFANLSITASDADHDGRVDDTVIHAGGQSIALLDLKAALVGAADFVF
jgi:Ca2+-binding RTX toxin-like protein